MGLAPLCDTFPHLFRISLQAEQRIKEMGEWVNERWRWKLKRRKNLFSWEEEPLRLLVEVVEQMPIIKEEDSWSFIIVGEFTARSMYSYLYNKLYLLSSFGVNSIGIVAKVWGSWAPSKVIVFSWQALHARLPTRLNLS
jgi:hypothetical protein